MSNYSKTVPVLVVFLDPQQGNRVNELLEPKLVEIVFDVKAVPISEAFNCLEIERFDVCLLLGNKTKNLLTQIKSKLEVSPAILVLDVDDSMEQEDLIHAGALDVLTPKDSFSSTLPHSVRMASNIYGLTIQLEESQLMLQNLAVLDDTTGLSNLSHFEAVLAQEWNRAIRDQSEISVALIVIDFYKAYNDDYVPEDGESTVQQVANVVKGRVKRASDLAAYHHEGTFALILPHTPAEGAQALCETLRERIEKVVRPTRGDNVSKQPVSASVGIASISPKFGSAPDAIVAMANDAIHEAIKSGANQVKVYKGSNLAIEEAVLESNSQTEENIYLVASLLAFVAFVAAIAWVFFSD